MSADAWRICPKCKNKRDRIESQAHAAYGKVSEAEYMALRKAEAGLVLAELPEVFREDFEIYMDEDGEFNVSYHGECTECGFKHTFKHVQKIKL